VKGTKIPLNPFSLKEETKKELRATIYAGIAASLEALFV
jgi:hypothetical protein